MLINFDVVVFIFLFGIVQGISLIIYFGFKGKSLAFRLLGLITFLSVFSLVIETIERTGIDDQYPFLRGISLTAELLIFPLFLIYQQLWSAQRSGLKTQDVLLFLPFIIITLWWWPFLISGGTEKIAFFSQGAPLKLQWLVAIKGIIYIGFAWLTLRSLNTPRKGYNRKANRTFLVLSSIMFTLAIATIPLFYLFVYDIVNIETDLIGALIFVFVIETMTWLAFNGRNGVLSGNIRASGLTEHFNKNLERIENQLTALFHDQKVYLVKDMSIRKLSLLLKVNANDLSYYFNNILKQGFKEYLNQKRIDEFKLKVANGELRNKTLVAVAEEAGFGSKASFNRAFKEAEGITPSEFIKR